MLEVVNNKQNDGTIIVVTSLTIAISLSLHHVIVKTLWSRVCCKNF